MDGISKDLKLIKRVNSIKKDQSGWDSEINDGEI